uniref:Actin-related protein 10 n=1 Tax=Macrostomum lignano TaxID=282301 RepID=A0A1I8GTS5_9PLAT
MSAPILDPKAPLLDINYSTEKPCIVVELGHSLTKCGIAGEFAPRWISPSVAVKTRVGEAPLQSIGVPRNVWDYKEKDDLRALLVDFFHSIYFKYLLVNPKERPVLLVESVLCPTLIRDTVADVLFHHFEAPSLLFAPAHLLSLLPLGTQTGLVLDCGYKEALVVPVFHGVSVLKAWQAAPLGAEAIHLNLQRLLGSEAALDGGEKLEKTPNWQRLVPESLCEDIKVRACFVTRRARAAAYAAAAAAAASSEDTPSASSDPEPRPVDFELPLDGGRRLLSVPGRVRELACEALFEPDSDGVSLPALLLDSLLMCPVDLRAPLASNILVIGGTAMLPGFNSRLREELTALLEQPRYRQLAGLAPFKFHSPPGKANFIAWLGGAIMGALEVMGVRALTREQYRLSGDRMPDWPEFFHGSLSSQEEAAKGLERR